MLEFTGREAISQPFEFELELVSERPDLETLLHQRAFLAFDQAGHGIHGQIYRVVQGESGKRLSRYHVTLRPQLAYQAHRTNQRIFQHLSVAKIISQVLKEHGFQANAYQFQPGLIYRRVYHEENGDKLDAIRGELSYSPVEGITLPAIEIKELAWL